MKSPVDRSLHKPRACVSENGEFLHDAVTLISLTPAMVEDLSGVNHQPSNRLKVNRQKRAIFTINCHKKQLLFAVKAFQGLSNIIISASQKTCNR